MRGDGISVPLRLTHTVLADLVAARRPTVSSARDLRAWLLTGEPPGELLELQPVAIRPGRSEAERNPSIL